MYIENQTFKLKRSNETPNKTRFTYESYVFHLLLLVQSVCLSLLNCTFGVGVSCSGRGRFGVWESTGEEVSEGHQEIQTDHHPNTANLHIH